MFALQSVSGESENSATSSNPETSENSNVAGHKLKKGKIPFSAMLTNYIVSTNVQSYVTAGGV